ncbi:MAG: hypothetical protein DRN29_10285 [Thermoplasmata archaeon]|nr:MAG: hypothetical protein DRN29_10285 [Thermoplasmata archaeon]
MKKLVVLLIAALFIPSIHAIQFGFHCDDVDLIKEFGVDEFINACYEKGYDAILVNVMPWEYYFNSPTLANLGWEFGSDLLAPLIQKAHAKGMKVYADIQTLAWKVRENYDNPGRKPGKEDVVSIVEELINYGVDGLSEEMFPAEWMAAVYEICSQHGIIYIHKHIPYDVAWFNMDGSNAFDAYSNCSILMTEDYYMNDDLTRSQMAAGFCASLSKELWIKSCPEEWALGSIKNMENLLAARALQYNPPYIFAMIYNMEDFEEFEPYAIKEIIDNFSYAPKKKILNVVVYLTDDSEDLDAWQLFDISYAAIANAAEASGYIVYITNEPMENAHAYFIYTRGKMNNTLHLPSSIFALFNQSKPVFLEVAYDLPNDGEWKSIREKLGISQKEFWSLFGTWRVKAEYKGVEYYHLSDEWYLFNPIEPDDVSSEILSYGRFGGKTYAFIIKNGNFVFINGAGLDGEASFPISNILNDALQQPFHGICSVSATSIFYAYDNSILRIKFPYEVERVEYMERSMEGEEERGSMLYTGEFSYMLHKGDLLILQLILNETISIRIIKPRNHLYINDREIMTLQNTVIIGKITIEIEKVNVSFIEIYINDELKYKGNETKWLFDEPAIGKIEIKAIGYGTYKKCEDSIEAFIFNW